MRPCVLVLKVPYTKALFSLFPWSMEKKESWGEMSYDAMRVAVPEKEVGKSQLLIGQISALKGTDTACRPYV